MNELSGLGRLYISEDLFIDVMLLTTMMTASIILLQILPFFSSAQHKSLTSKVLNYKYDDKVVAKSPTSTDACMTWRYVRCHVYWV